MTLNERIEFLENQIKILTAAMKNFSANVEEKDITPYTIAGGTKNPSTVMPIDAKTGLGVELANHVIWNDSEGRRPPMDEEPPPPQKGYNKHSHSRYSGGALVKDVLEIVEYTWGGIINKESQQFWKTPTVIKTERNSKGEQVEKIGLLDLVFNPDTKTWGVASLEIDVKRCYLVERDTLGVIALDSKGNEKKSPLYNSDSNSTSIVWDENGNNGMGCWRFYAVFAPQN